MKQAATMVILDELMAAVIYANDGYKLADRLAAISHAEQLSEAAFSYLGDYLARELHDATNAAEAWLRTFGATLDAWDVAERAAAAALGNY